jgi:hypothetical protein
MGYFARRAVRCGVGIGVACLPVVACSTRDSASHASADDPNRPAVIRLPPPILPSDTAKPDTTEQTQARIAFARNVLIQGYAVISASLAFRDPALLREVYSPDAVLQTPDSTYRGLAAVSAGLAALARGASITELRRSPDRILMGPDSTVLDSGTYVIVSKREGGPEREQRGRYGATWRMLAPPMAWALKSDRLHKAGSDGLK